MVQSALGQRLHLAGLILSSSFPYPTGPVEAVTMDTWHETVQSSLLGPISLIQSFLPLVSTQNPDTNHLAPNPTFLKDRLPHPIHHPLSPPSLQRPRSNHPLSNLLPRTHPKPRTPHNPSHPTQPRNLRSHSLCHPREFPRNHPRRRNRVVAESTPWPIRQSVSKSRG